MNFVLGMFLTNSHSMVVSNGCSNIALLARTSALPLPNCTPEEENKSHSDNPFDIGKSKSEVDSASTNTITKFTIVYRLFHVIHDTKLSYKTKEKAIYALGALCCGEKFPFAKHIIGGFLLMAKNVSSILYLLHHHRCLLGKGFLAKDIS